MEKPPFQFGLKAVFVVTVGTSVLASFAVPGSEAVKAVSGLAIIAALAFVAVLSIAVLLGFAFSLSMMLYHIIRLCFRHWNRPQTPRPPR